MKNLKLVTPIFICLLMANKKMNAQQTKELLGQKQVLQTVEQNKQPDRISADANIKERILTPVKDGDYSIMPLILPGDSVEKNYYVKQYGSKVYLNGDIIVKDLSLLSTASYSRNDNKHTFGKNDLY